MTKKPKSKAAKIDKASNVAKDLLFDKFKKSPGIKIFVIKYSGDNDKVIYNKTLIPLKEQGYLDYSVNFSNIQIFLTDLGREIIDKQDGWEIEE